MTESYQVDYQADVKFQNVKINTENCFMKTILYFLNFLTTVILVITVAVCLIFACHFPSIGAYQLHIILCVLGYQLFMCLGILVLSKYNFWSTYIKRKYKRHLHWILQVIGLTLAVAGSIQFMNEKPANFNTAHGILALCALIMSFLSLLNGILAMNMYRISSFVNAFWIKLMHYVTGMATLFCAAASLCFGFDKLSFKTWANNDAYVPVLMILTWMFTIIVSIDFWIHTRIRFRHFQ